ncbi:MAG: DEAD/DEAH box helicase [Sphingobacteriales bacterium]|nr:MAG: DEAD/DEAH box helicase [Sphingobacteriales bacterium]
MQNKKALLDTILSNIGIRALNEMQVSAMEAYSNHQNIILLSATGSGKTLAFLLPIVPLLQTANNNTKALIIVPSRELALQIEQVFKSLGLNLKVTCCYGGHKREIEENNLIQAPALIIGTPGRLADHIRRGNIKTATIETLVLDEFDKSLELGFQEEMSFIIGSLPAVQKRILTSATSLEVIPDFVGLQEPVKLDFLADSEEADSKLEVKVLLSDEKDKVDALFRLICMLGNRSTIVFCNHRESVERSSTLLKEKDIHNVFYHGAMEQRERDAALCKFRNGTSNILVTTDLAARGLDIAHIRYIIHYHLPMSEDVFTHRNGRTARMDASGTAILIIGPGEKIPEYIPANTEQITLPETITLPDKPSWTTLFIAAGKKDKINKIDIVGFLTNKGKLKKEDIGLIEVKDFFSFVGVRKIKVNSMLHLIKDEKIKNKKVKIAVAK